MSWKVLIGALAISFLVSAAIVIVGFAIETLRPARRQSFLAASLNLKYLIPYSVLPLAYLPLAGAFVVAVVNAAGGGWITLPDSGWWFVVSVVAFTLAMDFAEFSFHVAQHRIPFLWALHSLHHSDPEMNVSTAQRHFWADRALKMLSVYPLVAVVFKAGPGVLAAYVLISYYNFFPHMNLRLGLGRWSWLINSPQYHRLHHSFRAEDRDKRFAAIFPIFDVIFGFYIRPAAGDYPPTGLDDGDHPSSVTEAVLWPVRSIARGFGRPRNRILS